MFGARLKELREKRELSQRQLAKLLKISPSSVAMYELDQRSPDKEMISLISTIFQVSSDYLLGLTDKSKKLYDNSEEKDTNKLPDGVKIVAVYSLVLKNGDNIFAYQNIIGQMPIANSITADCAVEMNNDSMLPRIKKGSYLIIQKQETFNNGQDVLAKLPDGSYTIR